MGNTLLLLCQFIFMVLLVFGVGKAINKRYPHL